MNNTSFHNACNNELNTNSFIHSSILNKYENNEKNILHHKKSLLLNEDALNKNIFDEEIFDLIITSPPYNVDIKYNSHHDDLNYEEYLIFSEQWMQNCFRWAKKQCRFCLNIPLDKNKGGQRSVGADLTILAQKVGWKYHSTIIWNEGNISRRTAWGSWLSATAPYVISPVELIVVLYKDEWKKTFGSKISDITKKEFMDWTNGLWTFNGESKKRIGHPAPFPLELPFRCIKLFSYIDDIIFDPFVGSGTTLIAANNTNRYSIGLEIDKKYCGLAKQRIINETKLLF
ncbi:MAG: site-specific DNA-methyltransferase [Bacteroidales bacterium]|nr:site-specific DNA-methyltransferase [Bacteroidales bacterium]